MANMIDLTETSSDEEDNPSTRRPSASPPLAAGRVNGAARRIPVSGGANGGGRVVAPPNTTDGNGESRAAEKAQQPQNRNPLPVWKGMRMGKAEPTEAAGASPAVSGWGDPLPPDPTSNRRDNGMVGATAPVRSIPTSHGATAPSAPVRSIPTSHLPTAPTAPVRGIPTSHGATAAVRSIPTSQGMVGSTPPVRVPMSHGMVGSIPPVRMVGATAPTSVLATQSSVLTPPIRVPTSHGMMGGTAPVRVPTSHGMSGGTAPVRVPTSHGMGGGTAPTRIPTGQSSADVVKREPGLPVGDSEGIERMTGSVGKSSPSPGKGSQSPAAAGPSSSVPGVAAAAPEPASGVCRQFWRAGDYEAEPKGTKTVHGAMDHVRVHPKFLHSNATSHKWAIGAIAELLDNAVDEVQNGATFVSVDKIVNPRDGCPALLVQDDGGGMAPDTMRACMSLGYSRKNTNTTIGQYGNGFKTSTMRLGADVVVFSRHTEGKTVTQSIGLLSYTFLRKTGREDVVVPMIDYEVSPNSVESGGLPTKTIRSNLEDWMSNLSSITQWSPYSSEAQLLEQFDGLGWHGTKVIVYNLWFNDDGVLELDFDTDEADIQLRGGGDKGDKVKPIQQTLAQNHIANRYHHSLRVYTSILYLRMPEGFQIILRGTPVEHHSIMSDLKFPEQIIYKPQIGDDKNSTTSVHTVIGFTKEAPLINVHGFNVYHKNRLIMPFWKVWQENSSRGRGVVGVLEANFVEPAHDKQDFERTAVLMRLETRLKQMTVEYWNLHCHLIGYQPNTKAGKAARKQTGAPSIEYPAPIASLTPEAVPKNLGGPSGEEPGGSRSTSANSEGPHVKTEPGEVLNNPLKRSSPGVRSSEALQKYKRQRPSSVANNAAPAVVEDNTESALVEQPSEDDAIVIDLIQENSDLRSRCASFEADVKKLEVKVQENSHLVSRCASFEVDVKKLELKVVQLEKDLLDAKMKNVNLQEQLQRRLP